MGNPTHTDPWVPAIRVARSDLEMAGGNPGAASVLAMLRYRPEVKRRLDELEIVRDLIWIAWKDASEENPEKLADHVKEPGPSPAFLATVRRGCYSWNPHHAAFLRAHFPDEAP